MIPRRYYSPLRYPGGKAKIAEYIKVILEENLLLDGSYVEPYAGGASVALDLLMNEYVSSIHINDIDKSIYSFWHSVIHETDRFCEKIEKTDLTIEVWHKQKEIQSKKGAVSKFELGFSTFYLNRTNRSGILKGGVIGGQKQSGKWKIDARFSKKALSERVQKIALYKDSINIYNEDAVLLTRRLDKALPKKSFFYFDPPYYNKGRNLYVNYYSHFDHVEIAKTISKLKKGWIVSYDNVNAVKDLYSNYRQRYYSLSYSAAAPSKGREVLIFNDGLYIPGIENPTSRKEINRYLCIPAK